MAKLTGQEQIAPDESAAAEPEIEAVESLEAETEEEPDETSAAKGGRGEAGCPIQMGLSSYDPIRRAQTPRCA